MQAGKCAGVEVGRLGGEEVGRWVGTFACQHVYYMCTTNMSYLLFLCISVLYMVIGDNLSSSGLVCMVPVGPPIYSVLYKDTCTVLYTHCIGIPYLPRGHPKNKK